VHIAKFRALGEGLITRIALNRVSDRLLFPQWHSPERLMRQVRDAQRYWS